MCEGVQVMGVSGIAERRRVQIIGAARALYEQNGIERTSVKDIAAGAGITRSLFYHYFDCKEDVTAAILDQYVDKFIADAEAWDAARTPGDVRGSLDGAVALLRRNLFDADNLRADLLSEQNAALYQRFVQRVAEALAAFLVERPTADYARGHEVRIRHPYESFYLLITGLIGYLRHNPDASDALVADLVADTLQLDLG